MTTTELNTLINSLNDKALSWYQTINKPSVSVPGVSVPSAGTQYAYKPAELQPSGASTTPSGGVPPTNTLVTIGLGLVVVVGAFFIVKKVL